MSSESNRFPAAGGKAAELAAKDKQYVWHPFTQMQAYVRDNPVIVARGEGVMLYDLHGKAYYDAVSSIWLNVHGHNHSELNRALKRQVDKIAHSTLLGSSNVPAIELAERLVGITPAGLNKVFYSEDGSEAVEIALKLAYQYWRNIGRPEKRRFITMENAYHGDTLGAMSVGAIPLFHQIFHHLLFDAIKVPYPHLYRSGYDTSAECAENCLRALDRVLAAQAEEVAALIVEPLVQGAGGILQMPDGFLAAVAERCREHNILLIVDEVATGFGKTGSMFACEQDGVRPDLMALGKGITGGYLPLAATLATDEIYEAFLGAPEEHKAFYHGHSYTGNQLACAVALANLDLFEKNRVVEGVQVKSRHVAEKLSAFAALVHVGDIRQRGLMVGIELVADKDRQTPYPPTALIGAEVTRRGRELGILLRPLGDVMVFMPPFSSSFEELDAMLNLLYQAIRDVTEQGWRSGVVGR